MRQWHATTFSPENSSLHSLLPTRASRILLDAVRELSRCLSCNVRNYVWEPSLKMHVMHYCRVGIWSGSLWLSRITVISYPGSLFGCGPHTMYKAIWILRVNVALDFPYPPKWYHLFLPTLGPLITHLPALLLALFFLSAWNYFEDDALTNLSILEISHTHLDPSLFPSSETSLMSHLTTIRLLINI